MARRPSTQGEKTLGFADARGHVRKLMGLLLPGIGLRAPNRILRDSKPRQSQQARSQRQAAPCAAAPLLQARPVGMRSAGIVAAISRPAVSSRARAILIGHRIRHAHPDSDSSVPFDENLPMGMSAESIG